MGGIVFYRNSIKLLRQIPKSGNEETDVKRWEIRLAEFEAGVEKPKRGTVNSFSNKSKSRLQHLCQNANEDLISQLTLTYDGSSAPTDGEALKADLNRFLVRLRKQFPKIKYVWVLEFHKSGNPHFHVFTTLKYSPELAKELGHYWNKAVNGSESHLKVHQYVPKHRYRRPLGKRDKHGSFCPWKIGNGAYLAYKYLSKSKQKSVPPHFRNVGRFWGASRRIVRPIRAICSAEFYSLFEDTINTLTGEYITAQQHINRFFRDLRNYQEKRSWQARKIDYRTRLKEAKGRWSVKFPKRFLSPVRRACDATINQGVQFYEKWFEHYQAGFDVPF